MIARTFLDELLELSVVGSFTSAGYRWRRHLFDWQPPPPGALRGRTVAITGPTSGIGRAATDGLAALGARIVLLGRTEAKLAAVAADLVAAHGEDRFPTVVADMSRLESVRAAAARIRETEDRLDVLVDCAGTIEAERTETAAGIERTFATMVVGPFVLEAGLLPMLRRSPDPRIVAVTSGGMYADPLDLDDLQLERTEFSGPRAYARAKRAQTTLVREWARRLAARGDRVRINVMHPGWADTPGLAETLPAFYERMRPWLRTAEQGADTIVWLAADADARRWSGRLFLDRRPRPFDRIPQTRLSRDERRRLWDAVVELSGVADPLPTG